MLLINGMPVIHIELKRSDVPVSQAYNQIEKYSHEGVFRGLFSMVQVFVAMEPKETVYFANPGEDGVFNNAFYFHWADFDNVQINDWDKVVAGLLNITFLISNLHCCSYKFVAPYALSKISFVYSAYGDCVLIVAVLSFLQ